MLKKPKPVTATTVLTADHGSVVYSDSFTDSNSGWFIDAKGDPSTSYTNVTDRVDDLPHLGWLGDLVVGGEDTGAATVTATHFEERDLTG